MELRRVKRSFSPILQQSSITLVGELLFKVTGISGKAEIEEDEDAVQTTTVEISRKVLTDALGKERRDRVLSALYIVRQDAVAVVRQAAIHIWKALVQNTPRTSKYFCDHLILTRKTDSTSVRELLPELVSQLIYLLVDKVGDSQEVSHNIFRAPFMTLKVSSDGFSYYGRVVPETWRANPRRDSSNITYELRIL